MDTLTFPSRIALVLALSAGPACGSDPAVTKPSDNSANGSDESDDSAADDGTADDSSGDSAASKDAGKTASKDAGAGKLDAGATSPKDAGRTDAGGSKADASTIDPGIDAGSNDAGRADAGANVDASVSEKDASSVTTDAGKNTGDAGKSTSDAAAADAGSCSGATPHGCYVAESDNPKGCPAQIHEQSAFYPPMDEWESCSSPFYTPCNYTKPSGGDPAHCECDLGLHWLCTY